MPIKKIKNRKLLTSNMRVRLSKEFLDKLKEEINDDTRHYVEFLEETLNIYKDEVESLSEKVSILLDKNTNQYAVCMKIKDYENKNFIDWLSDNDIVPNIRFYDSEHVYVFFDNSSDFMMYKLRWS